MRPMGTKPPHLTIRPHPQDLIFFRTYHGHIWTWISGGIWWKKWVLSILLSPHPIWRLTFYPTLMDLLYWLQL